MRIVQAVRRDGKVQHRHIQPLGAYDELAFQRYRTIVGEWKHLDRSAVVLEELGEKSGRLQGRGYFRRFQRW